MVILVCWAFPSSRIRVVWACPSRAAMCRGVWPAVVAESGLALCSNNSLTNSLCPIRAAQCRGVWSSCQSKERKALRQKNKPDDFNKTSTISIPWLWHPPVHCFVAGTVPPHNAPPGRPCAKVSQLSTKAHSNPFQTLIIVIIIAKYISRFVIAE